MKKNILIIINTILCIILLVNQLLFCMVYNLKKIELKDSINYISSNIDTTELLKKIDNEENKILDKIYQKAKEKNIEEKTINKVLNSNEIKIYFKDNININIDSFLNNKQIKEMSTNEFNTLVDENIDKILNSDVSNDKKQIIVDLIEEYSDKIITKANTYSNKIANNKMTKIAKLMFKNITSIILLINTLIIITLLIIINHSYYKWALWSGVTTFVSSTLILISGIIMIIFKYGLNKYLSETINNSINILTNTFIKNLVICSLIGLFFGIMQVVYGLLIINKIKRRDKVIKLVLLRHGESVWNMENKFTGWTDVELSEKGIEEAKQAGILLKKDNFKFDLAYTSVLKRANNTLKYVLEELDLENINIKYDWRLNERHYGALQGLNKDETRIKYGEEQVHIWRRSADVRPPSLIKEDSRYPGNDIKYKNLKEQELPLTENLLDTMDRVVKCFNETIKKDLLKDKQIILVAHGNSIRALIKYLDNISTEEIMNIEIPTGKPLVYELDSNLKPIRHYYL